MLNELIGMHNETIQATREAIAALEENARLAVESAFMESWVAEQRQAGRPEEELTWGQLCPRARSAAHLAWVFGRWSLGAVSVPAMPRT